MQKIVLSFGVGNTTSLQVNSEIWWLKSCGLCSKVNQIEQFLQYLLPWVTQTLWNCKKNWVSLLQLESINSMKRQRRKECNSIHLPREHFQFRFRYMLHRLITIHIVISWVLACDLLWCIVGTIVCSIILCTPSDVRKLRDLE